MLQLELLPCNAPKCPLLRFSGDDPVACTQLTEAFQQLASRKVKRVCISDLPGIEPIDDCSLTALLGTHNRGVVLVRGVNSFEWLLTAAGWDNNAGLIEPFCEQHCFHSHQWLDSPSDVAVLLSPSGQW